MKIVAELLGNTKHELSDTRREVSPSTATRPNDQDQFKDVIFFEQLHQKKYGAAHQRPFDSRQLTVGIIHDQLSRLRQQDAGFTQAELARRAGISPGYLSKILNGQRQLSDEHKRKFYEVLFVQEARNRLAKTG
jgi:hypothetical protein